MPGFLLSTSDTLSFVILKWPFIVGTFIINSILQMTILKLRTFKLICSQLSGW